MIVTTNFIEADKRTLFGWINDPEVVKFNSAFKPVHWVEHCEWWESINQTHGKASYAIRSEVDNRILGIVQLQNIHPIHRHAEVSIRIGDQNDRQKGLGSEALRKIVQIAFNELNLKRVFTHVWADNPRAIRAYENAGFMPEGVMPSHVFIRGEWKDVVVMGINS